MFLICGMHFCSVFCEFECGWLPPVNAADCHLSIRLIASFWSGWCHTLHWPGCQFIHSAWVPLHLIWPERHVTLASVPIIHSAWVPLYWFSWCQDLCLNPAWVLLLFIRPGCHFFSKLASWPFISGKSAILSKSASSPICNLSGWFSKSLFAAVSWCTTGIQQNFTRPGCHVHSSRLMRHIYPSHGWWAPFIKLAWLALFERTFCETLCQKLDICWKPFCETSSPGVGIWEACQKLLLKRENPTAFWTSFLKKKSPAVQREDGPGDC
jgi:hypothetical protein